MKQKKIFLVIFTCLFCASACHLVAESEIQNTTIPTKSLVIESTVPKLPTVAPKCTDERGYFSNFEMASEVMNYPMEGRIYFPPCYDFEIERAYPVLYFLHGQSFTDDQWDRLGADEALDALVLSGAIDPFIIVMPKETNYLNNQWDSKYGISLAEELVAFVDQNYRTVADRKGRAIGGLSRGAAWAFRVGMIYWETFNSIGCHSFAPFRGDYNEAPLWFKEIPTNELPRIYIDMGYLDVNLDPAYHFEERLVKYGIPHEWHFFLGTHNEDYWSSHVRDYLLWYAAGWK